MRVQVIGSQLHIKIITQGGEGEWVIIFFNSKSCFMTHSRIWAELRMNHPSFTAEEQYPLPTYILAENSNNKNSTVSTFNSLLDYCYTRINVKPRRGGGVWA